MNDQESLDHWLSLWWPESVVAEKRSASALHAVRMEPALEEVKQELLEWTEAGKLKR